MKAKVVFHLVAALIMVGVMAVVPAQPAMAEGVQDEIAVLRDSLKADRTVMVAEAMQLSEADGAVFWPIYRAYRADLDKVNDGLIKLVLEYADVYPNVPEERAGQLLKGYLALERKLVDTRADYLKKIAKSLTAAKALRLAQVENRLDLMIRLQLAGAVPLVPAKEKQADPAVSPIK
jgi:hypothetical protein